MNHKNMSQTQKNKTLNKKYLETKHNYNITNMKDTEVKKMYNTKYKNKMKVPEIKDMEKMLVNEVLNELVSEELLADFVSDNNLVPKVKIPQGCEEKHFEYNSQLPKNSVDNLIMFNCARFLKHRAFIKADGEKGCVYLHSKGGIEGHPHFHKKDGESWTNWKKDKILASEKFVIESGLDQQLNCFSVNLDTAKFGIIDTDSPETEALVKQGKFKDLPYTYSFRGKGKHRFFRKHPDDFGKYLQHIKVNDTDLDILYSGNLFERRLAEGNNKPIIIQGWEGDYDSIPVVRVSELEQEFNYKHNSKITDKKRLKKINRERNAKIQEKFASRVQLFGDPKLVIEPKVAVKVLFGIACPKFVNNWKYDTWKKVCVSWFQQVPCADQEQTYLEMLQEFTKRCYNLYEGPQSLESWTQAVATFWTWCAKNLDTPETECYKHTLWRILYDFNEELYSELCCEDRGRPSDSTLNSLETYDAIKKQFELFNYCVRGQTSEPFYISENETLGSSQQRKQTELKTYYQRLKHKVPELDENGNQAKDSQGRLKWKTKSFINDWIMDCSTREYEIRDFLPIGIEFDMDPAIQARIKRCGKGQAVHNTFKGTKAEEMRTNKDLQEEIENMKKADEETYGDPYYKLRRVLQHIYYLSGGRCDKEYNLLLKWLANRVRYAGIQPKIILVFQSVQGTGKDWFFAWFGNEIIGTQYYINTDNYEVVFGQFNDAITDKLVLVLNESDRGNTSKFANGLKTLSTEKSRVANAKYKQAENIRTLLGVVMLTNKENPVALESSDRRFQFFICEDKHLLYSTDYFSELQDDFENEHIKALFVDYLYNEVEVGPDFDFKTNRVRNDFTRKLLRQNESIILRFVRWCVNNWEEAIENNGICEFNCMEGHYTKAWYSKFQTFLEKTGANSKMNQHTFMEDFINRHKLKATDDPDDHTNCAKFIRKSKGSASSKYSFDGDRLADFLRQYDTKVGYFDEADQPNYDSLRKEGYMEVMDQFLAESDGEL